jgi:hypothetical protein
MISHPCVRNILCIEMATRPTLIAVPSLVFLTIFLLFSRQSAAGVLVVDSHGDYKLVEFIQGHRQRMVQVPSSDTRDPLTILKENSGFVEIYDLDKGTDTEINYADKSYGVSQYPPWDATPPEPEFFRSTGKRRKVLGYWCNEYRADMDSAKFGKWTSFECISSEPPGAKEYIEYERIERSESIKAGDESSGYEPDGFVLDQGAAEGPDITFIKTMALPPTVFEPPAGFVKDKYR